MSQTRKTRWRAFAAAGQLAHWFCILTLLILAHPALAQPPGFGVAAAAAAGDRPAVTLRAVPQRTAVRPGDQIAVAVVLDHAPGYHSWPVLDQDVLPPKIAEGAQRTKIEVTGKPGWVTVDGYQWPEPHKAPVADPSEGGTVEVATYGGQAVAFIRLVVDQDAKPGKQSLPIHVFYQACNDSTCLFPEDVDLNVEFEVLPAGAVGAGQPNEIDLFQTYDPTKFGTVAARAAAKFNVFGLSFSVDTNGAVGLTLLLLLAVLGGFVLNLTPCVLPVIPLKIMGLSHAAGQSPARCLFLGVVMCAGVVAFWFAIGAAMAFVAGFTAINTLFQYPAFPIAVGLFIGVMALGMFGAFAARLPNWVYAINPNQETVHGTFLFGVMTAVLSTPCTAPFMGSAAAWAATQSPVITMATFGAIGIGMALPYLLLAANPRWINKVPRTGPGSELVKQVMGLLMLAVAIFFLGTGLAPMLANPPRPPSRLYWWPVGLLVAAAGVWLVVRTVKITRSPSKRAVFGGLGLLLALAGAGLGVSFSSHGPIKWEYYTPEVLAQAKASGKVVVVDFTAEWCINCKALESGVLHRAELVKLLNDRERVIPIKVDLSGNNVAGAAYLKEMNWVGIPLLVISGPGVSDPFKYDSYQVETVRSAIEAASGKTVAASAPAAAGEPPFPLPSGSPR